MSVEQQTSAVKTRLCDVHTDQAVDLVACKRQNWWDRASPDTHVFALQGAHHLKKNSHNTLLLLLQ